mmetsp:Transcript_15986/g.28682  ORF Transcript_15986/g.28682 Transcript_15986/m.28682 type:complete len:91 (-) Transcript_15986:1331-1603(-)
MKIADYELNTKRKKMTRKAKINFSSVDADHIQPPHLKVMLNYVAVSPSAVGLASAPFSSGLTLIGAEAGSVFSAGLFSFEGAASGAAAGS